MIIGIVDGLLSGSTFDSPPTTSKHSISQAFASKAGQEFVGLLSAKMTNSVLDENLKT